MEATDDTCADLSGAGEQRPVAQAVRATICMGKGRH